MKRFILIFSLFISANSFAQDTIELNHGWLFSKAGTTKWYPATIPGNVYTDLLRNKIIRDPFHGTNEKTLSWVDSSDWVYKLIFIVPKSLDEYAAISLNFDGLDTYAEISVNGHSVQKTDNMFRAWKIEILPFLKKGKNDLSLHFNSVLKMIDKSANEQLPIILPDNNRVYVRKAQYQFGWDWGPKFIGCGIWKRVSLRLEGAVINSGNMEPTDKKPVADLIQQKDTIGESFFFKKDGKRVYIKGANWIPANPFPSAVTHDEYRKLLLRAKDAHMNMLRVWGGGIYEDDYFYDLCDSLNIMVWQDFMFAGGMYPADKAFLQNVKEEVKQQIHRLYHHPCIVLWCGNNEIDEAWHNWGWQDQFNIHGADSARLWQNYKTLFEDSLKAWVNEFDGFRPYIPSSPKYGWGHDESFKEGDSHYWGLWWGLEPWESFQTHTGRFVSEYGMQSMPNYNTVKTYVPANDLTYSSPAVQWHQKANEGFYKLNFYLDKYFIDLSKLKKLSLEEYTYLTQCLQYYILKNSIAVQRSKEPYNMGTLVWQLNDCWPATSWSITDYSRAPKAGWYAVKEAYRDDIKPICDTIYPKKLLLKKPTITIKWSDANNFSIQSDADAKYVFVDISPDTRVLSDNYFDLKAGEVKLVSLGSHYYSGALIKAKVISFYDILNK